MRKLIISLLLFSLACSALPPMARTTVPSLSAAAAPSMYAVEMRVTGNLHVRVEPGNLKSCAEPCYLHPGDVVTCYQFATIGDEIWCRHEKGWSNARWLVVESREKE